MIWWILGTSPDGFLASGVRAASEKSQMEASEVTLPSPSSVSGQDDKSKLHHRRQQCGGPRSPARPSAPHENDGLATEVKYSSCGRVRGSVRTPRHPGRARTLRPASEGKGGARHLPRPRPRPRQAVTGGPRPTASSPSQDQDQGPQPWPPRTATVMADRDDGAQAAVPPGAGAAARPPGPAPRGAVHAHLAPSTTTATLP